MQVYLSGAVSSGRDNLPIYQCLVARLQAAGIEVPSAHVADPSVLARESAVPPREAYVRDIRWIVESDAMVADPIGQRR